MLTTNQKGVNTFLATLPMRDNGQFDVPLAFYQHIVFMFYIALIILLMFLAC